MATAFLITGQISTSNMSLSESDWLRWWLILGGSYPHARPEKTFFAARTWAQGSEGGGEAVYTV